MKRVIISACDPAAALHLSEVAIAAKGHETIELVNIVQGPAIEIFKQRSLSFIPVDLPRTCDQISRDAHNLKKAARTHLEAIEPDYLLTGLSSPKSGGIDEALLFERHCPAYLFQDFWGEQNRFFGRGADKFLVLDDAAANISQNRHSIRSIVVGSPKHQRFVEINFEILRRNSGREYKDRSTKKIIGFFGQSLHKVNGYNRTLEQFSKAISAIPDIICLYRPHPLEASHERDRTISILTKYNTDMVVAKNQPVEETIAACDLTCSAYSNCLYDAAFINHLSPTPITVPVMLLFDEEIIEQYRTYVGTEDLPYRSSAIAQIASNPATLRSDLQLALTQSVKQKVWQSAKTALEPPDKAAMRILSCIASR